MPIYLCAESPALEACIATLPTAPRRFPSEAFADESSSATSGWRRWLEDATRHGEALLVTCEGGAFASADAAALATALAALAQAGRTLLFAGAAVHLSGQTIAAPAHPCAVPAVVFRADAGDHASSLGAGLADPANRHGCVLLLIGELWVRYDQAPASLAVRGYGTLLLARATPGTQTLASASLDVLTDGMVRTLAPAAG